MATGQWNCLVNIIQFDSVSDVPISNRLVVRSHNALVIPEDKTCLEKNLKRVIATIVITLGMVFVGASAAYAHNAYVYHGNDWGVVGSDHLQGKVSDQECDGHDVYMYLWLQNGNLVKRWDKDGCKNGVKSWSVNSKVNWSFVCEARPPAGLDGDVCSNNVTHWNG